MRSKILSKLDELLLEYDLKEFSTTYLLCSSENYICAGTNLLCCTNFEPTINILLLANHNVAIFLVIFEEDRPRSDVRQSI